MLQCQKTLSLFNITYNKTIFKVNKGNNQVNDVNNRVNNGNNQVNGVNNQERERLRKEVNNIYAIKKASNISLSNRYDQIYKKTEYEYYRKKAYRLENCSSYLEYTKIDGKYRLTATNLCRVRLCPMCAYKRSLAIFRNTSEIIEEIKRKYERPKYLFITLTVKNVKEDDLEQTINSLNKGWIKMARQKQMKQINLGAIRTIEITYNEKTNTFHPHIHVLLHTSNDRYAGRNYISREALRGMWKTAAGLEYDPQIDIRRVYGDRGNQIAEIAKYSVKPMEWEKVPESVIITLDNALHKRHLITASGSFKEIKRQLKIDDMEERKDWKEAIKNPEAEKIIFKWHFKNKSYDFD